MGKTIELRAGQVWVDSDTGERIEILEPEATLVPHYVRIRNIATGRVTHTPLLQFSRGWYSPEGGTDGNSL